jgi:hypothetical protein
MNTVLNQTCTGYRQQLVLLNNAVLYNHDGLQIAYGASHHKRTRHVNYPQWYKLHQNTHKFDNATVRLKVQSL